LCHPAQRAIDDIGPQAADRRKDFGNRDFGGMKWKEAYKLPGSAQIGIGKKILEKYDWYKFKAHHEWVEPHYNETDWTLPYAAGIPKKVRIIYFPSICFLNIDPNLSVDPVDYVYRYKTIKILDLSRNSSYKAFYINPRTGKKLKEMEVNVNKNNEWVISSSLLSSNPSLEDWLLVLEDT